VTAAVAVELALQNRMELREADAAVDDAERDVQFARHHLLPQLDVSLALTRRETSDSLRGAFGTDRFEPVTFVSASTPLDRTSETVALQTAIMERTRRVRARDTLRRLIGQEARRAVRQQLRLANRLESAAVSVEFAEREVELATLRFRRGLSNNLDVVNAQANLLTATTRRLGVLADLALARLELRATLGTLDVRRDVR
jgi:outer membrane protein TolC